MANTLISTKSNQNAIEPELILSKLRSMTTFYLDKGYKQEDAHEFLRHLMTAIEDTYMKRFKSYKDLNKYDNEWNWGIMPLNEILAGFLRSTVQCLGCKTMTTTTQSFAELNLDITLANTVEQAIGIYFECEQLEEMGYTCVECENKTTATKQFCLDLAPEVLCIHLKRFSSDCSKLDKHVDIQSRLNLTPYTSGGAGPQLLYRLVAMVTHHGDTSETGHYTAIGITDTGNYYHFDDKSVQPIGIQNVLQTNAYIIFYELENGTTKNPAATTAATPQLTPQLQHTAQAPAPTPTQNGRCSGRFSVYIANLPYYQHQQEREELANEIHEMLSQYWTPRKVLLLTRNTERITAFAEFSTLQDAQNTIMKFHGTKIFGRIVTVEMSTSFNPNHGRNHGRET